MSNNDRRGTNSHSSSAPPRPAPIDSNWDDETVPGLDLDDPLNEFDRVTAVPEVPSEQYVKSVMEAVEDSRVPAPGTPPPRPPAPRPAAPRPPAPLATHSPSIPTLSADEYFSLDSEPPLGARGPDSTGPYAAILPNNMPTARPSAPQADPAELTPALPLMMPALADFESSVHDPSAGAMGDLKDRYAMGDFSGALLIAEGILEANPADPEAPRYAQSCRDVLTQMYSARLGSLDRVVLVAVPSDQIRWLTLDHRAGFLLSLIDGGITADQILDISGMPRLDALRIMYQLLDQRVISLAG